MYDKLVAKVDNIDTSGLVKKTYYNTKISEIENKSSDIKWFSNKNSINNS